MSVLGTVVDGHPSPALNPTPSSFEESLAALLMIALKAVPCADESRLERVVFSVISACENVMTPLVASDSGFVGPTAAFNQQYGVPVTTCTG